MKQVRWHGEPDFIISCSSEGKLKREVHIICCTDNCTLYNMSIYVLGEVYIVHSTFPSIILLASFNAVLV